MRYTSPGESPCSPSYGCRSKDRDFPDGGVRSWDTLDTGEPLVESGSPCGGDDGEDVGDAAAEEVVAVAPGGDECGVVELLKDVAEEANEDAPKSGEVGYGNAAGLYVLVVVEVVVVVADGAGDSGEDPEIVRGCCCCCCCYCCYRCCC